MVACQEGHAETAKLLLDKGAFIDFQDKVRTVVLCEHYGTSLQSHSQCSQHCLTVTERSVTSSSSVCGWS